MKLLGHESMATSQHYVISAGSETKAAAAQNPLDDLASDPSAAGRSGSRQSGPNEAHSTEPQ
jgi:integrase/recombinase XerC